MFLFESVRVCLMFLFVAWLAPRWLCSLVLHLDRCCWDLSAADPIHSYVAMIYSCYKHVIYSLESYTTPRFPENTMLPIMGGHTGRNDVTAKLESENSVATTPIESHRKGEYPSRHLPAFRTYVHHCKTNQIYAGGNGANGHSFRLMIQQQHTYTLEIGSGRKIR